MLNAMFKSLKSLRRKQSELIIEAAPPYSNQTRMVEKTD